MAAGGDDALVEAFHCFCRVRTPAREGRGQTPHARRRNERSRGFPAHAGMDPIRNIVCTVLFMVFRSAGRRWRGRAWAV